MESDKDQEQGGPASGGSSGVPAGDTLHSTSADPVPYPRRHWRESTISEPGLDYRGNVFFAAIEMTRMPMVLTDPAQADNPIVFANKAFLDLTQYEEDEILGRNCRFLQGAQSDRAVVRELRDAVEANQSVAVEILNYKRDGTPFWNAVFIGPVYDRDGKLLYFFASQLDVTRRRNSEQTHRQAQKMEAIGQLTAGLAHDFNNLLQVVTGNLELLAGRIDDPRGQRQVASARAAAERGAKLTRQLLAFARKTRLEARGVDLRAMIDDFEEVIRSSLGNEVKLEIGVAEGLPPVFVDPEQLEMAMLNILLNARDASKEGDTVRVKIDRAAEQSDGRAMLAVEIGDDGEGMAPNVLERATEPFFSTKGPGRGTGLGLAMASGFVQQSRGRLEIESKQRVGTTVRLLLPVADEPSTVATTPAPSRNDRAHDGGNERILIVEDTPEVLALATEILSSAGYRVSSAIDADDALREFDEAGGAGAFDLLFTDLVMPGGRNGILLSDELRGRDPALAVLMTTGYNEELVVDGPSRSDRDVLGKPYRRSELLDRVRQALNQRGQTGPRRNASEFGAVEA